MKSLQECLQDSNTYKIAFLSSKSGDNTLFMQLIYDYFIDASNLVGTSFTIKTLFKFI